jgi:beta-lactamase class A
MKRRANKLLLGIKKPTKRQVWGCVGALVGVCIVMQFLFPTNRLVPFTKVDGLAAGGWLKKDASWELTQRVANRDIDIQRGNEKKVYETVSTSQVGVTAAGGAKEVDYPWYVRLLPTSILWYGLLPQDPTYSYSYDDKAIASFIKIDLAECKLAPQNATLAYRNKKLEVVRSINGGVCKKTDVERAIKKLKPKNMSMPKLSFTATITPPSIKDVDAAGLKESLEKKNKDITLITGNKQLAIPYGQILSWLVFDNSGDVLTYALNEVKTNEYFAKNITPLVAVSAGVTKVTTRDFSEVSRSEGATGRTLDAAATRQSIIDVIADKQERASTATIPLPARVEYTRTYSASDVGLSALLQQFTEDSSGTHGIQYIELTGQKRRASYNESKQFITASTYKLYVAYSTLKRVESGQWSWNDQVTGGQTLTTCFDKMIVNSDNPCAEALYSKIGYQTVINEARSLGLPNTTLSKEGQKTTAGDLATFLGSVYSGAVDINAGSRSRLVDAMKRNVYRKGVPAGANGVVADKVGFLNGLLHDASIVYSDKGDYVLVVMTDGSSWDKIVELTRKIESIR